MLVLCILLLLRSAWAKEPSASLSSDCGGGLQVLHAAAWPGGGLSLSFLSSTPRPAVTVNGQRAAVQRIANIVTVNGQRAAVQRIANTSAAVSAGVTGFLLVTTGAEQVTAAQAAIESLPALERVLVWTIAVSDGSADSVLLVDATTAKGHALPVLSLLGTPPPPPSARRIERAVEAAVRELSHFQRYGVDELSRNLVIVSTDTLRLDASPSGQIDMRTGRSVTLLPLPLRGRVAAQAGVALAGSIAAQRAAVFRAGVCLERDPGGGVLLELPSGRCRLLVGDWSAIADASLSCSADDVAAGAYPFPDMLSLVLTAEQEPAFEKQRSFLNATATPDEALADKQALPLSVIFGTAGKPLLAEAHFRGSSTLRECVRKSINVRTIKEKIWMSKGSWTAQFYLISMCEDFSSIKTQVRMRRAGMRLDD
jgi:hypothetical protein